jgi:hypothetical protein
MSVPPMPAPDAPRIVTLGFDEATFERLDALRRRFFPADRNLIPAHLSLFHALLPEEDGRIGEVIAGSSRRRGPLPLRFGSILRLGTGFALKVEAPGLVGLHRELAGAFEPWLTPQDRQPLRPHVTLMNKAGRAEARMGLAAFRAEFEPWEGLADSVLTWAYLGGPWRRLARYPLLGETSPPSED